jgi:hypothetical protein
MRGTLTATLLVALLLALPSAAQAAQGTPPGNSAVDQYLENVPGAGGNHPSGNQPGGGGGGGLSPGARHALAAQGPAGVAAANLAGATAPRHSGTAGKAAKGSDRGAKQPGKHGGDQGSAADTGGSPFKNAVDRVVGGGDSGGGMGIALPIILGSSLLGALLLLFLRRRGGATKQAH